MKILPLCIKNNNYFIKNSTVITKNNEKNYTKPAFCPSTLEYLAFLGGKSMNLKETKEALDKLGGNYPPDIEKRINDSIKKNENKTLIDIHLEKYSDLNKCDTLEEAKFFYPEFNCVVSDSKIKPVKGSFIEEVKNGQNGYFDPDKDLALQLLQIYWRDGFSLNDIKQQFAGKNIDSAFRRFNIPRVDRNYGHYLKFSDKKYNERFTNEMSERMKKLEIKRKANPNREYAKRGPLADEHKRKISEGLERFYLKNPDAAFEISKRTQKYYEEHPEEKDVFSMVLERAWNYPESMSIKKKLSKFLEKQKIDFNIVSTKYAELHKQSKVMKTFWEKNPWAKKIFSKLMTQSWAKQKELMDKNMLSEPIYTCGMLPPAFLIDVAKYNNSEVQDISNYAQYSFFSDEKSSKYYNESENRKNALEVINNYLKDNPEKSFQMADTLVAAINLCIFELCYYEAKSNHRGVTTAFIVENMNNLPSKNGYVDTNDLANVYAAIMELAVKNNDLLPAQILDRDIAVVYSKFSNMTPDERKNFITNAQNKAKEELRKVPRG